MPLAFQYAFVDGFTGMGIAKLAIPLSMMRKVIFLAGVFLIPRVYILIACEAKLIYSSFFVNIRTKYPEQVWAAMNMTVVKARQSRTIYFSADRTRPERRAP